MRDRPMYDISDMAVLMLQLRERAERAEAELARANGRTAIEAEARDKMEAERDALRALLAEWANQDGNPRYDERLMARTRRTLECRRPSAGLEVISIILPDCMMPDGAAPCRGYQQVASECNALRALLADMWRVVNEPVSNEFYVEVRDRYEAALREGTTGN